MVQVGQIISSPTNNVGGGTVLLILSDLSRVFILASVDESDIGGVQVGQPVQVTVDAFPNAQFAGEVVRVATKGESVSNVVTFEVKIEVLDEAKAMLLPEMTANIEVLVADSPDALLVPSEAVVQRGNTAFVLTPNEEGARPNRLPVEVGIDDGAHAEILSGVDEGAEILVQQNQSDSRWGRGERRGPDGGDRAQRAVLRGLR